jgi:hypothetical protein
MVTILLIILMSIVKKKKKKKRRRRGATRNTNITRRRPMVRHTLARNETSMMRVLTPIVMVWPP